MARGGVREGAGRPKKYDELKLIERLSPLDDQAFENLKNGLAAEDKFYTKLFFEYRFGKPRQIVDLTNDGEAFVDIHPAIQNAQTILELNGFIDRIEKGTAEAGDS